MRSLFPLSNNVSSHSGSRYTVPAVPAAVKAHHSMKNVDLPVQSLPSTLEGANLNSLPRQVTRSVGFCITYEGIHLYVSYTNT